MLICPQCELENPDNHKYCQRCGLSLTHKNCHKCGSQVSLSALQCHNCEAYTGQIWKAVIYYQTEVYTPSRLEVNVDKLNQEEFITGASPSSKDYTESAVKIMTEDSEKILESSQNLDEKTQTNSLDEKKCWTKKIWPTNVLAHQLEKQKSCTGLVVREHQRKIKPKTRKLLLCFGCS